MHLIIATAITATNTIAEPIVTPIITPSEEPAEVLGFGCGGVGAGDGGLTGYG